MSARSAAARASSIAHPVQPHQRRDPVDAGHPVVKRVLFRAEADAAIDRGVAPDRLAEHAHRAFARLELAGDQLHERRLAGAVRTEQAGDAGWDGDGHVVEAGYLSVPLRQMLGGHDHVTTSTPRTRRSSTNTDAARSSATTSSAAENGIAGVPRAAEDHVGDHVEHVAGRDGRPGAAAGDAAQRLIHRRREEDQPGVHDRHEAAALRQRRQAPAS